MPLLGEIQTLRFRQHKTARPDIAPYVPKARRRSYDLSAYLRRADWQRLTPAIRRRFGAHTAAPHTDYYGSMEVVRRSWLGYCIAQLSRPLGMPVPPFAGTNIPTIVSLYEAPGKDGIVWERHYRFPNKKVMTIKSTKLFTQSDGLLECVSGGLGMRLDVYEQDQKLHFVSKSYFWRRGQTTIDLPHWLSPGVTHVVHTDEGNNWFRFTMTITHPLFGELYFQEGIFKDEE